MKNQQMPLWLIIIILLVVTLFTTCTEEPEVENPPVADFSATPLHGDAPLEVHFTNESQYDPESWSWNFGDGATSLEENPVHTYMDAGEYTVTLTVVKGKDSDSEIKPHYITVTEGGGGINGVPCPGMPTVTDIDGNRYNTVLIGEQCWMRENLKVTLYPNGDAIPYITDKDAWAALGDNNTDDAYCYYENDPSSEYGALYSYAAAIGDNWARDNVEGQGICPEGWHLPTDVEWTTLIDYLGGEDVAGGKMKEVGTGHWQGPNTGATNESGFTALPGGFRHSYGTFYSVGSHGFWWSATEDGSSRAWYRYLYFDYANVYRYSLDKSFGFSVRCVWGIMVSAPEASFTATPLEGNPPLTVTFTDQSSNAPTSWQWDFGDGATSTEQHPVHEYMAVGDYTVTLTVGNSYGTGTETKEAYIHVETPGGCPATVTDIDGNRYNTLLIGEQCWMRENLRVTHYPNGDAIPHVTDWGVWAALGDNNTDDAYCYYENDPSSVYGGLYTYAAAIGDNWARDNAEGQGICPEGWHLPTDGEWSVLVDYLGGKWSAGGKMKEVGTAHWRSPNTGATNESGFTALPGGCRNTYGTFNSVGYLGYWWSATEDGSSHAWYRDLIYDYAGVRDYYNSKADGFSVRCVRGN